MKNNKKKGWGGHRPRAGRPFKIDKDQWGQVTCILRHDTIEMLRSGADSNRFGEFLQEHLDRYPPPTREEYLKLQEGKNVTWTMVKGVPHRKNIGPDRPPEMLKRARQIERARKVEQLQRDRIGKTDPGKSVAHTASR